jgi:hypothetical protein
MQSEKPTPPAPRKFKKLLPWQPVPGTRTENDLWIDPSQVFKIQTGNLNYTSKRTGFVFSLPDPSSFKSSDLIRLLPATITSRNGNAELAPAGGFIWIKPEHVFAIGSRLEGTAIWLRPGAAGDFVCQDEQAITVMIGVDDSQTECEPNSGPRDVAKLLGIELG